MKYLVAAQVSPTGSTSYWDWAIVEGEITDVPRLAQKAIHRDNPGRVCPLVITPLLYSAKARYFVSFVSAKNSERVYVAATMPEMEIGGGLVDFTIELSSSSPDWEDVVLKIISSLKSLSNLDAVIPISLTRIPD